MKWFGNLKWYEKAPIILYMIAVLLFIGALIWFLQAPTSA